MILDINFLQKSCQWLHELDTKLFLQINTVLTSPILDAVYPWWREGNAWIPLYLFLIVFMLQNFKSKALGWILFALLTITLSDQISSHLIKPFFQRLRPCNEPLLANQIRLLLNGCSGGYSFTSSHATNHFAFALFVYKTLGFVIGKWKYTLPVWAASVAYGQVYVGVHYPLDILVGSILGTGIGYITAIGFHRLLGKLELEQNGATKNALGAD
jgi:undecaprenyl-diphosphatase